MRVKVWDTIFEADAVPIAIWLDAEERTAIAAMGPTESLLVCFPNTIKADQVREWVDEDIRLRTRKRIGAKCEIMTGIS